MANVLEGYWKNRVLHVNALIFDGLLSLINDELGHEGFLVMGHFYWHLLPFLANSNHELCKPDTNDKIHITDSYRWQNNRKSLTNFFDPEKSFLNVVRCRSTT